jgi:MFS-type transporter involved in bile tolerance (Atg22 family)
LTSAIGGALSGLVADRFGHKRTLIWILAGWIVILPALGLLTHFALFVTLVTLMGFWFGANWTVSRSMMSDIAPPQKHNLAFAYYGLVERASAFVGPVVWGLIVSNLEHLGALRYRIAVASIAVFVVVGVIALHKVRVHGFQKKSIPSSL